MQIVIMAGHWCLLLVGLAAIVAFGNLAALADQTAEQVEKEAQVFNSRLRANFQLPKMFDFARFKGNFQRRYESAIEEMVRASLFMGRAYRAFVTAVEYKYHNSNYYLAVNSRSDWTAEELEAAQNHAIIMEANISGSAVQMLKPDEEPADQMEPLVGPEELEAELKRIHEHRHEAGYRELEAELASMQAGAGDRRKRDLGQRGGKRAAREGKRKLRGDFRLSEAYDRRKSTSKSTMARVRSNNPDYQLPDVASEASLAELSRQPGWRNTSWLEVRYARTFRTYDKLPVKSRYNNKNKPLLESLTDALVTNVAKLWWWNGNPFSGSVELEQSEESVSASGGSQKEHEDMDMDQDDEDDSKADVVWVDHRQGGCLQPVQDQGHCGSCYAFASMAFFEWAHCKETGSPVKFSEQYVIDCGTKLDDLMGCHGGIVSSIGDFVHNYGLELTRHYPYKARNEQCPYEPDTPIGSMGYMRADATNKVMIPLEVVEEYLANMPLMVNINTQGDFHFYGGGVYDGFWCQKKGTHSVLLIGHGREDGEEYWLIRNSHSADYGEQGHLRLNKNSNCIHPRFAMAFGRLMGTRIKVYSLRNHRVPRPVQKASNATSLPIMGSKRKLADSDSFRQEMEAARRRDEERSKRNRLA